MVTTSEVAPQPGPELAPKLLGRSDVLHLMQAHGVWPSRALGQNFVADANTVRRVARLANLTPGQPVVEIGAGLGSLTLALVGAGAQVTAIEVDRRLVAVLQSVVDGTGAAVVHGDALELDWAGLLGGQAEWALVANLPYNVATPLVVRLLEEVPGIDRMLVMVQREAGERLAARVGDPAYGAVSAKVAYWATTAVVGRVPPTVFIPRPRVESVLVSVARRGQPAVDPSLVPYGEIRSLIGAGFAHRRKMLRGCLAGLVGPEGFAAAGISPEARAEELDVAAWARLAACRQPVTSGPRPS